MTRRRLEVAAAAAVLAAGALLLGGALRKPAAASSASALPPTRAAGESLQTGFSGGGDTAGLIERLQSVLRAAPQDASSLDLLGLAYQQRARETSDAAYYTKTYEKRKDDVAFYVELAKRRGETLEYGVGNGRLALPAAMSRWLVSGPRCRLCCSRPSKNTRPM